MKKKLPLFVLLAVLLLAIVLYGAGCFARPPQAAENEVLLKIRLDLKEDIGLLVIDHRVDGKEGSGGISNADKSMLRRDDVLYWSFEKDPGDAAETAEVTVRFTVVTEYADPNYDNIYPEETMIPLEPLSFTSPYGEIVSLRIEGDRINGYRAVLE
ncbi:MAG: hypothetical protein IJQ43_09310 [Oscillospiraceae bacterium]|nr:hypothetical protein [Oscillospiraceae bacterium]